MNEITTKVDWIDEMTSSLEAMFVYELMVRVEGLEAQALMWDSRCQVSRELYL